MKTKAVKVLCLALAIMLTFSAISPFAAGEEYVDNEAYIQREQEEPEADISIDVEMPEGEFIETEFDPYWFYNLPPEEGDPVDFEDLPILPEELWLEYSSPFREFSTSDPIVFVHAAQITSTSAQLSANIIYSGGAGTTIVERGFLIRRADSPGAPSMYTAASQAGNSFLRTFTGLAPDTEYVVQSIVRNNFDRIGLSSELRFTTLPAEGGGTNPPPGNPSAPRFFEAVAGDGYVTLSWLAPQSNGGSPIVGYQVSNNGGLSWRNVFTTTYRFEPLQNGTQYTFWVRAVNDAGNFSPNAVDTATPVSAVPEVMVLLDANGGTFVGAFDAELDMYEFAEISPMSLSMFHSVPIGTLTTLLPRPIRNGHSWVGWSLTQVGSVLVPSVLAVHSNATLYATWQQNPVITYPGTNGYEVFAQNLPLTITWQAVPNATYFVTLTNTSTNDIPVERQQVSGTSFTIPTGLLRENQTFMMEVFANVGGTRVSHSSRTFVVRPTPGIRVTVYTPWGVPLQGAIVHFLRSGRSYGASRDEIYIQTDHNGIAFFAHAPTGRYGIMVTHDHYVTTHEMIQDIGRHDANQVHLETFIFREHSSTFRNLLWGNIFENMGTVANPRYQITSIYGYREFDHRGFIRHTGVDITDVNGGAATLHRRLNAPFDGDVVWVFNQQSSATGGRGHGITMFYRCSITRADYYVSYYHMHQTPRRANGGLLQRGHDVTEGMQVGTVGGTPYAYVYENGVRARNADGTYRTRRRDVHLHLEVHRNYNHRSGFASWEHLMDPRAFWTPQIFRRRHHTRTLYIGTNLVSPRAIEFYELLLEYCEYDEIYLNEELSL